MISHGWKEVHDSGLSRIKIIVGFFEVGTNPDGFFSFGLSSMAFSVQSLPPVVGGDQYQPILTEMLLTVFYCIIDLPDLSVNNLYCLIVLWTISIRSEEHTSELQSRPHLVCRLLLEKKK